MAVLTIQPVPAEGWKDLRQCWSPKGEQEFRRLALVPMPCPDAPELPIYSNLSGK